MASDPIARLLGGIEGPVAPRPDYAEALLDRLLAELAREHASAGADTHHQEESMLDAATLRPANPVPIAPWRTTAASGRIATPGWRDRALVSLATAALVLLTLAGSFIAFGPHRPGRQEEATAFLAAPIGTPATPDAAQAALLVEFLWESDGGPHFTLGRPTASAIDLQGRLWVTDGDNDRILIFSPDGEGIFASDGAVLEAWGTRGSSEGEFSFRCSGFSFGGITFDAAGNIYIADSGNGRIQKFGPDRAFITSFGAEAVAANPLFCPSDLAVDPRGRLFVSDYFSGKFVVLAPDGALLAPWSERVRSPGGVVIDGDGDIWVADDSLGFVEFSPDGEMLTTWEDSRDGDGTGDLRSASGIAIDAQGRIFVADKNLSAVKVFSPDGAFLGAWGSNGADPGQFTGPVAVALDGKGHVYVVEAATHRVQKFRLLPPLASAATPAP